MRTDTIFDLASVSKLFTSIALVQQVEAGRIDLDRTVASYIPAFAANGKQAVTVRQLLTHTSGFPAWLPLWSSQPTPEARIQAVYDAKLANPPGSTYLYSDLNMITAGKLVELATGKPLDQVVHDRITGPLGMRDTGYNPPASELDRIAATEYQTAPPRGMVRGSVHDENAWALNGVAGHAGVFSTADDLAVLAQTIINGGSYGDARILSEDSVDALLHNENAAFPGNSHGLGFELDQRWYMDGLSAPRRPVTPGTPAPRSSSTGRARSFVILLTNRVHPSRNWGSNNPARRAVARDMALRPPGAAAGGPDGLVLRCRRRPHGDPLGARAAERRTVPPDLRPLVRHRADRRRDAGGVRRTAAAPGRSWSTGPAGPASSGAPQSVDLGALTVPCTCGGGTPPTRCTRAVACTSTASG